jgi:hypothetical protein
MTSPTGNGIFSVKSALMPAKREAKPANVAALGKAQPAFRHLSPGGDHALLSSYTSSSIGNRIARMA